MTIQEMFKIGMKRDIPSLVPDGKIVLNIGAGKSPMVGAINIDLPEYDAETMPLPFGDLSINTIYMSHFLEHLSSDAVISTLLECQRVLSYGGTINITVPHRMGQLMYVDIDHKTFFCEKTWDNIIENDGYSKRFKKDGQYSFLKMEDWKLQVGLNIIIGINERNLALLTQLIKS